MIAVSVQIAQQYKWDMLVRVSLDDSGQNFILLLPNAAVGGKKN
jgi:hypothetical protein